MHKQFFYLLTFILTASQPMTSFAQDADDILREYGVYDIVQQYADPAEDYDSDNDTLAYPSQDSPTYYPQQNWGYDTSNHSAPSYPAPSKPVYPTPNTPSYPAPSKPVYPTPNTPSYPTHNIQPTAPGQRDYHLPAPKPQPSTPQNNAPQYRPANTQYVPSGDADIDAILNDAYQLIDEVQPNSYHYPQYEPANPFPSQTPQNIPSSPSSVIPKQAPAVNSPTSIKQTPIQQPVQNVNPTKTVTTPTPIKQTPMQQPVQNINPPKTITPPAPTAPSHNTSSVSYRSLLSSYEQKLYDPMYKAIAEGRVSVSVNSELSSAIVKRIIEAIVNDHPELFWMSEGFSQEQTYDGQRVSSTKVIFDYNQLVNNAQAVQAFSTASAQVVNKARSAGSPLEMEKIIHDYLASSITYGQNSLDQSAYGAIVNKHCVCAGFARAFKHFMNQLGIPCYIVTGVQTDSDGSTESHAWNLVYINGKCYNVDVTSDLVEVSNGRSTQTQIDYRLFNKSDSEFKRMGYTRESEYSSTAFHLPSCN